VIRAEVPRAIVAHTPHDLQSRPLDPRVQSQRQEVLVVGQLDVEARLLPLDKRVFQQQGFLFVAGHHGLDVRHHAFQKRYEIPRVARGWLEILADAIAQIGGLADVQGLAATILH
jgi:hypothetical protein